MSYGIDDLKRQPEFQVINVLLIIKVLDFDMKERGVIVFYALDM